MSDQHAPFLPVAVPDIGALEERYVLEAVRSGWVSSIGEFVGRFEREFARRCDAAHGVSVTNGTDALFIAMKALAIGPGDEVIVPDLTFVAVASAVVRTGATPVFVDVHPDYWCLNPQAVRAAVGDATRAIVAVHSYGHPADMDALQAIADPLGIHLLEDCAEAHAARYRGRTVGSIGTAGGFSFYGNKILTTGEGGMIVTSDDGLAERCRYLKDHAMDPGGYYYHSEVGYNCRMTNLQAALGCAQLARLTDLLAARERVLGLYREALQEQDWLRLNPRMDWAEPVNWMVCLVGDLDGEAWRDDCRQFLRERGIDSRPFFHPLSTLPPYQGAKVYGAQSGQALVARHLGRCGLNLPSGISLSERDIQRVASALADFAAGRPRRATSALAN